MYTLDVEHIGSVRMRPHELRITNLHDIDPPDFVAARRERARFRARLAAAMAIENAPEPRLDPADLLPYHARGRRAPRVAIGVPVYGPYMGVDRRAASHRARPGAGWGKCGGRGVENAA